MSVLDRLNEQQKEAAAMIDGAILILAGAGSGKTMTITTRLAYLIEEVGIPPNQTLTLTFTNKAANEMRTRAMQLITTANTPPLLCTFHRFGLLLLRLYMNELNRSHHFVVIDTNDQKKIIRDIVSSLSLKEMRSEQYGHEISRYKNALLSPEDLSIDILPHSAMEATLQVYQNYENYLQANNLVDFDDLLLLPYKIFKQSPEITKEVSMRYQYVMVDEYQDTNDLQNKLLNRLLTCHQNICVVGDDDQSIYSWRGSDINFILNFSQQYKNVKTVKLEQNYRSSTPILEVANRLISHNKHRLGKTLISCVGDGNKVNVMKCTDDYDEISQVASHIKKFITQGIPLQKIAILFRLNAFTRSIEEGLRRAQIPFQLIGTIRFYERREIKDYLSYFRLIINLNDNFSLSSIINRPTRNIGEVSWQKVLKGAESFGYNSIYQFSKDPEISNVLSSKKAKVLQDFFITLESLQESLEISIPQFLIDFEKAIGLRNFYASHEDSEERVANIDELLGVIVRAFEERPGITLEELINEFSLSNETDHMQDTAVLCMSVHNSKGLEFEHVFVIGLEEGFFPLLKVGSDLEEERRLGYVAFTRAKQTLTLSYTDSRFFRGKKMSLDPSRFLSEAGLLQSHFTHQPINTSFQKGDLIRHHIFGAGIIEEIISDHQETKLTINFGGLKRDILSQYVIKI